ncbi:LOW QUALITY PROTEIN: protein mono-ADP-ribosyltransferase PARP14-like [Colossoma macropomum]|uniref:LOW QUALITY PROTEIN: protein mono-ADP-ribosyltransferase PARP14-like n=1 Tax=Colossoma macropomum TaxID=42526 RepID=UPI001863A785|nr:LOW QUALITY PROTEIN: protein mono-ADP-ribosyltransferase PARP14-like [Colossoma macropomum]
MAEKKLLLEGLPDDLDCVIPKLELYFKNKKRSGGEAARIQEHPEDKRKALLVYLSEGDAQNVLARVHQLDFRDLGVVKLTIKEQEDKDVPAKKVKPSVRPRRKRETEPTTASQAEPEGHKENEADCRSRSLLVSSSDSVDEDILILYFEQFSEQIEVIKHGESSWILNLASHSDLLEILAVKEHDFGISVEVYDEENVAEKWDPRRFILTGFKDACKYKLVTLFISSCSKKAEHTWELLDEDRIVVTFKEDIDVNNFMTACTTKKPQGMDIRVSRLELTDSVLVQGDMIRIKEDILTGHFSNNMKSGGGDIKSLLWMNKQKSVVITFKDRHAAYRVVEQKHHLCGEELTVLLFYSSLQKALTGETPTLSGVQTNIAIPVDVRVLNFIENNDQCKKHLQDQLKMVHAKVLFDKTTFPRKLVVEMAVDKESLAALQTGPTWENKARKAAQEFLTKYSAAEVAVELKVWKSVESTCLTLITPEADIVFKEIESKIVIVGLTEVVSVLLDKIKNLVKGTTANLVMERKPTATVIQRNSVEKIPLESVQEMEFIKSFMNLSEIPEVRDLGISLEYACDTPSTPFLNVTAAEDKIQYAVTVVKKQLSSIVMEKLIYSKSGESKVLEKNEANVKAKANEWNCTLYIEQLGKAGPAKTFKHKINRCITLTITEGDLHQYTADALICPMSTSLAFDNPTAQHFLEIGGSRIQEVCNKLQKQKQTLLTGNVVLSNPGNLSTKTLIYAVLPKSSQTLGPHYLKSAVVDSLYKAEQSGSASVAMPVLGCGPFGFSVKESCKAVREAILQFIGDHRNTQKNVKNIYVVDSDVKIVEEFHHVVVELGFPKATFPTSTPSQVATQALKPKLRSDTSVIVHGVQVSLKKGDITKETVDVIVNSNNRDLNVHIGVSGAIFKAAGKSIVNEYLKHGPRSDDVILTGGGNLSCKHIAQMFGPIHAADIITSIEKVLKLCESKMAATVAIPAIGTGQGGISAYASISAIFTGLENHLIQSNSSWLKKIVVVAFDQIIWDAFRDYFRERNKQSLTGTMAAHANQVMIEGVRIEVKKGNITNETVQAIVNTTNREMDLKTGVSGAIFRAAGPSVEKECRKLGPLQGDTVALTSAGKLQCDFIIHMMGPRSTAEARLRVKKVLEQCEQKKISTVSFPAVGTGGGGLNGEEAMIAILEAFEDHLFQRSFTAVKLVYVVVDRDEVLQQLLQVLKEWTADPQESGDDDGEYDEEANLSEEENQRASYNFQHAGLFWDPDTGFDLNKLDPELKNLFDMCDITEAQLKDKITSKVIYDFIEKKGGVEAVKEELRREENKIQVVDDITRKTKLKKKCKRKKLTKADIGTPQNFRHIGHVGFDVDSLDPELKSFFDVCGISEAQLKDKETFKVIYDFIERKGGVEAVKEQFRREAPKPTQQNKTNPSLANSLTTALAAISFPVTTVEVYGTSPADLAKVKKLLDDLISEECTSRDVQSGYLANLQEADKEAIVTLSKNNQVHILVASSDRLTVSGKKDDVLDTVLNISSFIQAAKEREAQESEMKRLRETLCWEVADEEAWVPLDSSISYQLELAFHKKEQSFTYEVEGEVYTVDLKELTQENSRGKSCRIKRTLIGDSDTAVIQPPPTWTKMEGRDVEIILLTPDSDEYKKIETAFLTSSQHPDIDPVEVVQIRRIQNKGQWQRYSVLKQEVDKKYPDQINEQFLYHGTTREICQKINNNGFNRSFCGRNAVAHGHGTYFALEAWYSCQHRFSNPDENRLKYVYRARVVTGTPCRSRRGMKEPDPLDPNDPRAGLFDCAVDNLEDPFIFVVFCDAGAYPDYLIIFKNT